MIRIFLIGNMELFWDQVGTPERGKNPRISIVHCIMQGYLLQIFILPVLR